VSQSVLIVRHFFDDDLCQAVRLAMDAGTSDAAEVLEDGIAVREEARRAASIDVDPGVLEVVERRLDRELGPAAVFFGIGLTGREGAGFLRYHDGGFYRPHRDRGVITAWPDADRRRITLVVFLNGSGFTGGVLRVGATDIQPETGTLVAFPSDTLHEVTTVRGGVRDAIVDWFR
jgi:predicted 2-oxoglutarate/Fe(II)-dependent dioxygenase YbiX